MPPAPTTRAAAAATKATSLLTQARRTLTQTTNPQATTKAARQEPNPAPSHQSKTYFRITLMRSAIGLPRRTAAALKVLGLQKRMRTVFHPVTADVAGQIFKVKELVAVREVGAEAVRTRRELLEERRPHPGFWVESVVGGRRGDAVAAVDGDAGRR